MNIMIKLKIMTQLNNNASLKHIAMIAGGTTLAQGINILSTPILSRIYSPEDFGVTAVFISMVSILSVISALRYDLAIPLPKTERYADAVILVSFLAQIIFVLLLTIIIYLLPDSLMHKARLEALIPYKIFISVGVLGTGIYGMLTQWAIRRQCFNVIAKTKITQITAGIITKMVLGVLRISPLGLILGDIVSKMGGLGSLLIGILTERSLPKWNFQDIKRVAIRYKNFPLFDIWTAIFNVAGYQLIPYLSLIYYDSRTTGYFAMANNLLMLPGALIGTAIGQVFLQRAAIAYYEGSLKEVTIKTYHNLLVTGIYPGLFLSLTAPYLFSVILGSEWKEAGIFAMIMGPWAIAMFIQSPLSNILSILGKQKQAMLIEILYSLARIAASIIGTIWNDAKTSIFLLMLTGLIFTIIRLWYIFYLLKIQKVMLKYLFPTLKQAIFLLSIPSALMLFEFNKILTACSLVMSLTIFVRLRYHELVRP